MPAMGDPEFLPLPEPAATIAPVPAPQPPNTVFRGPHGIRAGWRVLIFLALVAAVTVGLGILFAIFRFAMRGFAAAQGDLRVSGLTPLGLSVTEGALWLSPRLRRSSWRGSSTEVRAIRIASPLGIRETFLDWHSGGISVDQRMPVWNFRISRLSPHGLGDPWRAPSCRLHGLGRDIRTGRVGGRIRISRIPSIHADTGMGFWPSAILLSALFGLAHAGNPGESKLACLGSAVRVAVLSVPAADRQPVVGGRISRGMGLGPDVFYGVADSGIPPYHNLFGSVFSGPRWLTEVASARKQACSLPSFWGSWRYCSRACIARTATSADISPRTSGLSQAVDTGS